MTRTILLLLTAFGATVLAMPLIKDGYRINQTISEGAVGEWGFLQAAGFIALAAGGLLLARKLVRAGLRGTAGMVALSSICVALLVLFPTSAPDPTPTAVGRTHNVLAGIAFASYIAAMAWSARTSGQSRPMAAISLALALASSIFVVALLIGVEPRGAVQRAAVACNLQWMLLTTLWLRDHDLGYGRRSRSRSTQRKPTCDVVVSMGSG